MALRVHVSRRVPPFGLLITTTTSLFDNIKVATLIHSRMEPSSIHLLLALLLFPPKGCLPFSISYMGSWRSWKSNFLFLSFLTISPNLETQGPCLSLAGRGGWGWGLLITRQPIHLQERKGKFI
jgi:hypothetical protein